MSKQQPDRRGHIRRHSDRILFKQLQSLLEAGQSMNATLDLDRLLSLIMELATKNLDASRSTLYLLDEAKGEIWSKILQGEEWLHLRLPLGQGIAGYVAKTGETVNIQNAYQDPRFYQKVDEATGFVTSTVLCIPMRNRSGKTIGVLQVLNKKNGLFTEEDERFLEALSAHAAVAIENALLYKEAIERRQLEEQLRQAQKMEAIGRLAGGVAHDFNNLLTIITGYSELLLRHLNPDDPRHRQAEEIRQASERAATLTRQLLAFSRKQVLQPRVLQLNEVVSGIESMLNRLLGEDITLDTVLEPELGLVKTDAGQIEQVIMNLAVNARDAMPQGGNLTIETANVTLDPNQAYPQVDLQPGPYVILAVKDKGVGMDEETLSQIFEPFFTTKGPGKGTGLGLSTVYGIIKQSGGDIAVQSQPGQGTTFQVYLPRIEQTAPLPTPTITSLKPPQGWETILLVEDEKGVRKLAATVLHSNGYTILEADHGEEALRICNQYSEPIHLLITDVIMPDISGHELSKHLLCLRPELKVLYISGYADNTLVPQSDLDSDTLFLQKPFTPDTLAQKVRDILDAPPVNPS